ncbi:DUF7620 family protein [Nocardia otitidiscaviarum]|uniref:DUF7620 family protein n=1 Tax=Nocardia otitidiscaviarum TaxID=1823 RepID=UPI0004A6EF7B|nr:hypothetical protein [Nocardia otitidiscaviarum]
MWFRRTDKEESEPTRQARLAAQQAEQELAEVKQRRPAVDHLAAAIIAALKRNHFGEAIELSMELRRRA